MESLVGFLLLFPIFMVAVVVHEVSHGWAALALGDRTALVAGRLTLNPFKHMDLIGTMVLPLMLLVVRSPFVFGWAKPVPVNVMNLHRPKRDMLWVGAAGPTANFTLAVLAALFLKLVGPSAPSFVAAGVKYLILINLVLGVFNLIPIPPLDGSRILTGLLPLRLARGMLSLERWGVVLVMLLLALGFLDRILHPAVAFLARLLGVS